MSLLLDLSEVFDTIDHSLGNCPVLGYAVLHFNGLSFFLMSADRQSQLPLYYLVFQMVLHLVHSVIPLCGCSIGLLSLPN